MYYGSMSVPEEIAKRLEALPPERQERVLRDVVSLSESLPPGTKGSDLRKLAFTLDPVSAREMREAIEEGCERIDPNEW